VFATHSIDEAVSLVDRVPVLTNLAEDHYIDMPIDLSLPRSSAANRLHSSFQLPSVAREDLYIRMLEQHSKARVSGLREMGQ